MGSFRSRAPARGRAVSYFESKSPVRTGPRTLVCTRCGESVLVYEAPVPFIDPELFVCGDHLVDVDRDVQLELVDESGRNPEPRVEERSYDPALAEIPF